MIYQLIYMALVMLNLGVAIARHGNKKEGEENAWITLISLSITLFLLTKGGFFNVFLAD